MQVGCTGTALHVIHIHGVGAVILESIAAEELIDTVCVPRITVRKNADPLKAAFDGCRSGVFRREGIRDLSALKINLSGSCIVDAAQIKHQHAVDIDPHVIVAIEFKGDGVIAVITSAGRHHEVGVDGHTEIIVRAI